VQNDTAANIANLQPENHLHQERYPAGHPQAGQFVRQKPAPATAPFLGVLDKRTARAMSYQTSLEGYMSDRGGPEHLSHAEAALCAQAAGLETLCKEFITEHLAGREVDVPCWLSSVGHFRRVVTALGLRRHSLEINPPRGVRARLGLE
jgi:hypothetical protein